MSTPARVAEARLALARRLAMLRDAGFPLAMLRDAGFPQAQTARRIRYSRSAVARAEATGVCSRDFAA
jgi:hypothetical protein